MFVPESSLFHVHLTRLSMSASYCFARRLLALLAVVLVLTAAGPARAVLSPTVIGGSTLASSIQPTVTTFASSLGSPNNGNAAGTLGGRREINWDGGGGNVAAAQSGPTLTTFTNTRGATMTNPSLAPNSGFLQTQVTDPLFTAIQASYATAFAPFSAMRIFTPLGGNVTEVTFSVPGTNGATPATVGGFGAVFSDVDTQNSTKIELFDESSALLLLFSVPPGARERPEAPGFRSRALSRPRANASPKCASPPAIRPWA